MGPDVLGYMQQREMSITFLEILLLNDRCANSFKQTVNSVTWNTETHCQNHDSSGRKLDTGHEIRGRNGRFDGIGAIFSGCIDLLYYGLCSYNLSHYAKICP